MMFRIALLKSSDLLISTFFNSLGCIKFKNRFLASISWIFFDAGDIE
jgi:hypothetical protein